MTEATRGPKQPRSSARSRRQIIGRLISYEVTELFGIFDYQFDLDPEGPTLLTGVNGTGKSTILRSIDAISTGNWLALLDIPFKSLTLRFDSNRQLTVNRSKSHITIDLTGEETWTIGAIIARIETIFIASRSFF